MRRLTQNVLAAIAGGIAMFATLQSFGAPLSKASLAGLAAAGLTLQALLMARPHADP